MQSRRVSLLEAVTNVIVGYLLAVATQLIVFPLFDVALPIGDNLVLAFVFTVISLVRTYALRRAFERWQGQAQYARQDR